MDIEAYVLDPDVFPTDGEDTSMEGMDPPTIPLLIWILRKCALERSNLIISIKRGLRGVHYFCTPAEKKQMMIEYIDMLGNAIRSQF
eukprot:6212720-Ditylum_brightwellii.AAC.1